MEEIVELLEQNKLFRLFKKLKIHRKYTFG